MTNATGDTPEMTNGTPAPAALDVPPTIEMPATPRVAPQSPPPPARPPRWLWALAGAVLAAVVVAVIVVVIGGSSSDDEATQYKERVATVLAPVITANRKLSVALETLHGTKATVARQRVRAAQTATTAARGGLDALTVPAGADQTATNARGTLTREAAYLDAVNTALAHPGSGSAAQTQTLAANLTSALDVIAPAAQDWSQSVRGADVLTAWAPKAVATVRRRAAARRARQHTTGAPSPASGGAATSGGTDCGGGLHAGPSTSCPFAQNVRDAYYSAPGAAATVDVYSPVTGRTYTMSCAPAGTGVTCSGGNDASVSWSY